MFMIIVDNY